MSRGGVVVNQPCVVRVTFSLSIEFSPGAKMDFSVKTDEVGAPDIYTASVQGGGTGKPVGVNITGLFDITAAAITISAYGSVDSGSETVTGVAGGFICEYVPRIDNPP